MFGVNKVLLDYNFKERKKMLAHKQINGFEFF